MKKIIIRDIVISSWRDKTLVDNSNIESSLILLFNIVAYIPKYLLNNRYFHCIKITIINNAKR